MTIFERRLLFVVGKGGAGKTTVSASLALAAFRLGKRVLLVEVDENDAIGRIFNDRKINETPEEIEPGFYAARVNPKKELEEYVHTHAGLTFIANRITNLKAFDYFAETTPGIREIMTLGRIWRWEGETGETGRPLYDIVIVDAPATGHAQGLLRQPQVLVEMFRIGPIAEQTRVLQALLQNAEKTGVILVTLPEELPANEAIEFAGYAKSTLKMDVPLTVINCVYPDRFDAEELTLFVETLRETVSDPEKRIFRIMMEPAWKIQKYRALQDKYIERIEREIAGCVIKAPFFFTNRIMMPEIEAIASRLSND
jgi:anion-transporting  ArsA/GET3 family ATPase